MDKTVSGPGEGGTPEVRFRRSFAAEAEKRRVAFATWTPIWAASGIALGHFASVESQGGHCLPSHPSHTVYGAGAARLKAGDLVSVLDSVAPSNANQHLRRVVQTMAPTRGRPGGAALLGFAIPRDQWPAPMRAATVAVGLEVDPVDGGLHILRHGYPVAAIPLPDGKVNGWRGTMIGVIRNAARSGHADGVSGTTRGFSIKAATGPEGRTWDVVDASGTVHARDERGLLQRRPPQRVEIMLLVTEAAHAHACEVARHEHRRMVDEMLEASRAPRKVGSESENENGPLAFGLGR